MRIATLGLLLLLLAAPGALALDGPMIGIEAQWQDPVPRSSVTGRATKYVMQVWPDDFDSLASAWALNSTVTVYDPQSGTLQNAPTNGSWAATTGAGFYSRLFSWKDTDRSRPPEPVYDLSPIFPVTTAGAVGYRWTQDTAVRPVWARDIDDVRVEVFPDEDTGGLLTRDATVSWLTPSPSSREPDAAAFLAGASYEAGRIRHSTDDPPEDPPADPQRACDVEPVEPPGDYCIHDAQRLRPREWNNIGTNPGGEGQLVGADEYHPGKGYAHFRLEFDPTGPANPEQYVRYFSAQPRDYYPENAHIRAYRAGADGALGMNADGAVTAGGPGLNRRSNQWELYFCRSGYATDGAVVRTPAQVTANPHNPWRVGAQIPNNWRADPGCTAPYYVWSWQDKGDWRVYAANDPTCQPARPAPAANAAWLRNLDPRAINSDYHRYRAAWGGAPQVRGEGPWDSVFTPAGRCWIYYPGDDADVPVTPTATTPHQVTNLQGGGGFRRGAWFYPGTRIGRLPGENVEWNGDAAPIAGTVWRWAWNQPGTGFGTATQMCHGLPAAQSGQEYADDDYETTTYRARTADGPAMSACAGVAQSNSHVVVSNTFAPPGASFQWQRQVSGTCTNNLTAWQDSATPPSNTCGPRRVLLRPVPRTSSGTCPADPSGRRGVPGGPSGTWCVLWRNGHVDGHWWRVQPTWQWLAPRSREWMSGRTPAALGVNITACDTHPQRLQCLVDLASGNVLDRINNGCDLEGRQWAGTNAPDSPPWGDRGGPATGLGRWPDADASGEAGWYKVRLGLPTTNASFAATGRCGFFVPGYVAPAQGRWVSPGDFGKAGPGFKTLAGAPTAWPRNNRLDAGGWRVFAALSANAPDSLRWRIVSRQYAPRAQRWEWAPPQQVTTDVARTTVTSLQPTG